MSKARRVSQAVRRFTAYHGFEPSGVSVKEIKVPDVALRVGKVSGIMYITESENGELQEWVHRFAKGSRPHLATSHDGKILIVLGGAFQFTERGIVDRKSR